MNPLSHGTNSEVKFFAPFMLRARAEICDDYVNVYVIPHLSVPCRYSAVLAVN